jgi:hypothetical protein
MAVNDTEIYGISTAPTGTKDFVYSLKRGNMACIGRISSKLTIYPALIIQNGTTDHLNAPLYVICGGSDSGKLLIASTAPVQTAEISYIPLPSYIFRLRVNTDTGEKYLEVSREWKNRQQ